MPLPKLREELSLYETSKDHDGSRCWIVYDPTANRYYRIGWLEFEILARWEKNDLSAIVSDINSSTTLNPSETDVVNFIMFLEKSQLLQADGDSAAKKLYYISKNSKKNVWQWFLHNYLFFRIPLFKPDRFLDSIYPFISFIFSSLFIKLSITALLLGLIMISREWDHFKASFINTMTIQGVIGYVAATAIAKTIHELAHALTAKRYGLKVPRIGIAFLVMMPLLYTDVGEGWKVKENDKRRKISSAGIVAEFFLAAFTILFWGLLPDGILRDMSYYIAVVSLFRTVVINISPFMRFDGYYILSDYLNIPNLQERSFNYTKYWLRKNILALDIEPPEKNTEIVNNFFILYSLVTWCYRFVVFLGIAVTVYYYFFKLLGIILMGVEILYFILMPLLKELNVWRKNLKNVDIKRKWIIASVLLSLIATLFIPFKSGITLPAIVTTKAKQSIYSPFPARIVKKISEGTVVKKGDLLFLLDADDANFQAKVAKHQAAELYDRIKRLPVEQKWREESKIWEKEALEKEQIAKTYSTELGKLEIRADYNGRVIDIEEGVFIGGYVNSKTLLATVIDPTVSEIECYADETSINRIKNGGTLKFIGGGKGIEIIDAVIEYIDSTPVSNLTNPALADVYGGNIPTLRNLSDSGKIIPKETLYRIRAKITSQFKFDKILIGKVYIPVKSESYIMRILRHGLSVILRESGF